jgi:hypothetical protein
MALDDPAAGQPPVLHQAVVAMVFAVFLSRGVTQKHNRF